MKIAITGSTGQLGRSLIDTAPAGVEIMALTRGDVDLSAVHDARAFDALRGVDVVINAAAYTQVDEAETHAGEAYVLNTVAPIVLAGWCEERGVRMVHISSDYVIGAERASVREPLRVGECPGEPLNVYGRSKRAAEIALAARPGITVARTSWVYSGQVYPESRDFVSTMMRLATASSDKCVRVVADEWGTPTFSIDLAAHLWVVATTSVGGMVHLAGTGVTSWYEMAREIFQAVGADPARVVPITAMEYGARAVRPGYSALESSRLLPEWRDGVRRAVAGTLG